MNLIFRQIRLLEVGPGGRTRVKENEEEKSEQVWRTADVGDAFPNISAHRLLGNLPLILRGEVGWKEADALRRDLKHRRANQEEDSGGHTMHERSGDDRPKDSA